MKNENKLRLIGVMLVLGVILFCRVVTGQGNSNQTVAINQVITNQPLPEPTVPKKEADARAATSYQTGFQAGFQAGVKATEQARLEEQMPGLVNRAFQTFQQNGGR